jgi:hypothetical protein
VLAVYVTHPITKHLLISLSHSQPQLISNIPISNASINMVTAVLVSVPSPPLPPSVKAMAPTNNNKRQRNGSPKEAKVIGMQQGLLTQVLTMSSPGTSDMLSVLDLCMPMGTPAAGVRVKDTPKTSTHRATNGRGKKKASAAAEEKHRPTMKVGARVVVEYHHISMRVLSYDPGRVILDQRSHRNHNHFGVCTKKEGLLRVSHQIRSLPRRRPASSYISGAHHRRKPQRGRTWTIQQMRGPGTNITTPPNPPRRLLLWTPLPSRVLTQK